jgi:hypothetical protein
MVSGDRNLFAIESAISKAYERLSSWALGYFVIYINGFRYGVHQQDATGLACSFGEVQDRLARRGQHSAPILEREPAHAIADSILNAIYSDSPQVSFFGMNRAEFCQMVYSNHLIWAPDGDEAFDDGSFVLQIDMGDRVRLIGFKGDDSYHHVPSTLNDARVESPQFYGVLSQWLVGIEAERNEILQSTGT